MCSTTKFREACEQWCDKLSVSQKAGKNIGQAVAGSAGPVPTALVQTYITTAIKHSGLHSTAPSNG